MTTTIDPIAYMAAQIKAKAAKAAAAGKTAAQQSASAKMTKPKTYKIPELYKGERPTQSMPTARAKYLKSIDAALIKEAAGSLGLSVTFGLKPSQNDWKTAEIQENWDKITQIMADLKASSAVTETLTQSLPDVNSVISTEV